MSDEWKTIDTAPRDGRDLLLFCPDFDETIIAFYSDSEATGAKGRFVWQLHDDAGCIAESVPSHWMFLPGPPRSITEVVPEPQKTL